MRHAWCNCHKPVTSAASVIVRFPRKRGAWRAVGVALIGYGALGLLLVIALALSVAPVVSTVDALARSSNDVERTLATTGDAFDTFGRSLVEGRRSAEQAAVTARHASATAKGLGDAMSISIFGAQPLLGLATSFRQQGNDIESLAVDLDALATTLSRDERDVAAVRDQIGALHDRTVLISKSLASPPPVAALLYLALLWLGAQAAAAVGVGVLIWRREL